MYDSLQCCSEDVIYQRMEGRRWWHEAINAYTALTFRLTYRLTYRLLKTCMIRLGSNVTDMDPH